MQPEPHHTNGDTSPLPPPSPTLTTSFRHHPHGHQPAPNTADPSEPSPSSSTLRHRSPYTQSDGDSGTVRISIQTPFGDLGGSRSRRKEGWPLSLNKTISSIKEDLIHGRIEGAGTWEKEGMRVVYHGRIVRDDETLQDIIGKVDPEYVYVLHLVARRIPVTPLPTSGIMHQNLSEFPLPPQPTTAAIPSTPFLPPSLPSATNTNSLALGDTIHYLLFTSRHHLFKLLGMNPLKWDEMVPHPTLAQEKAREAIISVVRVFVKERESREEGWENWRIAFEGDSDDELKAVWEDRKRDGIERDIRGLWATATGRSMSESGEKVQVEVDGIIYTLQLPALSLLHPSQLVHLLIYLRTTTLLPLIEPIYHQSLIPPPIPTPTQPQPGPAAQAQAQGHNRNGNRRVIYRRTFNIRIPYFPVSVIPHLFWSGLKITAMVWMMTRGMRWNDNRFWVIVGLASGWWIIDALSQISRVTREVRARNQRDRQAQAQAQGENQPQDQQQGQNAPGVQGRVPPTPAPVNANGAAQNQRPTLPRINRSNVTSYISRFHLSTDSRQLRLPPSNLTGNNELLPEPRSRPSWIETQLILPILLWFITLVPEWESLRARVIRRRESRMRVIVGENQRLSEAARSQQDGGARQEADENDGLTDEERRRRDLVANLPTGLSQAARKYYLRVVERGEGIDWEEEREAQRALGVGEEDGNGGEDEGMRMRML
ncbi:hypothetical protein I302_104855 [Kwoniella bestiolae CBS 10118]|uniref:Ubiquitin-like domain-containing protein n=1 Tax=Kwoniella bestiolae CBS 10118 TaxID=1296100 RepID=A0A1B9FRK2_9TREE|nr:hypothetical protein I302_09075 [Kwoniella bestiolae CBS 10118]OCF21398.1 hypothetical protein I302_09075 [Kwoniella bestiolae CBS 10118]